MRILTQLLAVIVLVSLAPPSVSADVQRIQLGRASVATIPAEDLLCRITDHNVPPGQPGVTVAHAGGFEYTVEGSHVLTAGGHQQVTNAGQATWIGSQEEHTHSSQNQAGMRFWFFTIRPASARGAPVAWPYPGARIRSESANYRLASDGPKDLILTELRLSQPNDQAGSLTQAGLICATPIEGQVSLGGQALAPEAVVVQQPGDAARFRNTGAGPARLLVLTIVPAGTATQMPRTGAGGPDPWLPLVLAVGTGLLGVVGYALRRSRRAA